MKDDLIHICFELIKNYIDRGYSIENIVFYTLVNAIVNLSTYANVSNGLRSH